MVPSGYGSPEFVQQLSSMVSTLEQQNLGLKASEQAAEAEQGPVSPLLRIPGFCIWHVRFDIMHTLDLGVLTHALPSALTELTAEADVFNARTREERLQLATRSYRAWCAYNNVDSVAK